MGDTFKVFKFVLLTRVSLIEYLVGLPFLGLFIFSALHTAPEEASSSYPWAVKLLYYIGLGAFSLLIVLTSYYGVLISQADATYLLLAAVDRRSLAIGYYLGIAVTTAEFLIVASLLLYFTVGLLSLLYALYALTFLNLALLIPSSGYVRLGIAIPSVIALWLFKDVVLLAPILFAITFLLALRQLEKLQLNVFKIEQRIFKLDRPLKSIKFTRGNLAVLYAHLRPTVIYFCTANLVLLLAFFPNVIFKSFILSIYLSLAYNASSYLTSERLWVLLQEGRVRMLMLGTSLSVFIVASLPVIIVGIINHDYLVIPIAIEYSATPILALYLGAVWGLLTQKTGEVQSMYSIKKRILFAIYFSVLGLLMIPIFVYLSKLSFSFYVEIIADIATISTSLYLLRDKAMAKMINKLSEYGWK